MCLGEFPGLVEGAANNIDQCGGGEADGASHDGDVRPMAKVDHAGDEGGEKKRFHKNRRLKNENDGENNGGPEQQQQQQ